MSEDRLIEFTVRGLAMEPKTKNPILLLQDPGERLLLPIWIGASEASAILVHVEGKAFPRPFTHDLFNNAIEALGARIVGVALAVELVEGFLDASFSNDERHRRRLDKVRQLEEVNWSEADDRRSI